MSEVAPVQLLYFAGCPHADEARRVLHEALDRLSPRASLSVEEIDVEAPGAPEHLREWGSPTILVSGEDVGGEPRPTGRCCRLYQHPDGSRRGAPPLELLLDRLGGRPPP
jgi:mercuric ion transport protein